jgi:hypothetical protein
MKKPVDDALVAEYTKRLRSGGHVGMVFPFPLADCDFNEAQKFLIAEARKVRRQLLKSTNTPAPKPATPKPVVPAPTKVAPAPKSQSLTKLEKMFYLQQERCFFCGEKMTLAEANIEHLHPLSKGGTRSEDNEVVCHKTLNDTFGDLPLKQKFEFVLKTAGSFSCPKK